MAEPVSTFDAAALLGVAEFELKLALGRNAAVWPVVAKYIEAVDCYVESSSDELDRLRHIATKTGDE